MSNPAWKQFERRVASLFSTTRSPLSGGNSKHTRSDSLHPALFLSCKYSQRNALHSLYKLENKKSQVEDKLCVLCTQVAHNKEFLVTVSSVDLERFCRVFLESAGYQVYESGVSVS